MYYNQKRILTKIAIGSLMMATTPLYAGISATAVTDMTNFLIKGSDGNVLDATTDFVSLSFPASADLNGDVTTENSDGSTTTDDYTDGSTIIPIDLPVGCAGTCPTVGENLFPIISGQQTADYSTADTEEGGAPIANITGLATGANVSNAAYVSIANIQASASANSNNNLNANFTLTKDQPNGLNFSFDMRAYLEAYVDDFEVQPGFSTANYVFEITVTDELSGVKVLSWKPNGKAGIEVGTENADPFDLNETISKLAPASIALTTGGIHVAGTASTGNFSANTLPLYAGRPYQLSARINTNTDARRQEIPQLVGSCRMTGGNATVFPIMGIDGMETWSYEFEGPSEGEKVTTGGQINAPSGNQPPSGHWEHTLHGGQNGEFSFHAGTSSAPAGTQISSVECADPGWCVQARCAPFKQLFWKGIGNFANQRFDYDFGSCNVVKGNRGTLHAVEVMIGDFGENDHPTRKDALLDEDPETCDWLARLQAAGYPGPTGPYDAADAVYLDRSTDIQFGHKGGQVCDKCPDYYQIRIWCKDEIGDGMDPENPVIYEFAGFLGASQPGGGNYQIHPETGEQCPLSPELVEELFVESSTKGNSKNK